VLQELLLQVVQTFPPPFEPRAEKTESFFSSRLLPQAGQAGLVERLRTSISQSSPHS